MLITPDMDKPFKIECDSSDFAVGAVLLQQDKDENWRPLAYESKKLSKTERNYPAQERELLAILVALRTWRCFIDGKNYIVTTDHKPLIHLQKQQKVTPRLVRWISELDLYIYTILLLNTKKALKTLYLIYYLGVMVLIVHLLTTLYSLNIYTVQLTIPLLNPTKH